jgi:hypothetical protein
MTNTKTLLLAGFAALSMGVGTAMAQESAGGYIAGPFDQQNTRSVPAFRSGSEAQTLSQTPQYGGADHTVTSSWPVLEGGDGN